MTTLRTSRTNSVVVLLTVCTVSTMLGVILGTNERITAKASQPLSASQSDEKLISIVVRNDELVEFGNLSVRNVKVSPNQKFSVKSLAIESGKQGEDWIENLEFSVKNKSDKQITAVVFELQFPETEVNGPLMGYSSLSLGVPPNLPTPPHNQVQSFTLQPGDKSTFQLSASSLQRIKDFLALRKFLISDLNNIVIKVFYLTFDDGMKWSSGHFYRSNPSAPGGYERIPQ